MKLIITQDTYLKAFPLAADDQRTVPKSLIAVAKGASFDIELAADHAGPSDSAQTSHVYVQLKRAEPGSTQLRWYVYGPHALLEGTEHRNNPTDTPATAKPTTEPDTGPKITIPGISRSVGIYEPIYYEPKISNFTWAELTKGGSRIPVDSVVAGRIVKLARYMDEVRGFLGNRPIRINSGYRDPVSNRAVGGALDSRHMYGDAVDFWIEGEDVVDTFCKLKGYHAKGGLAVGRGFVHLDLRPGAAARWRYPGGPNVALW